MSADAVALVERVWLDLWNRRAIDELMDVFDPAYFQRDHRPLRVSGTSSGDWREMMEGWWALVPDYRCIELTVIAAAAEVVAYTLRFEGTDLISGGRLATEISIVNRIAGGRACEAHLFSEADEAAAYFGTFS